MEDKRIEQLAARLAEGAEHRIDADATARAVLQRLRAEPEHSATGFGGRALRIAAAIVLLLAGGLVVRQVALERSSEQVVVPAPVELRDLAAAELADVLDSLEFYRPVSELVPATLQDLDEHELRQLLQWMEG